MKAIKKKILLASLSICVLNPFSERIVHAEKIMPTELSNNKVEVNTNNYKINDLTTEFYSIYVNYDYIYGGYSGWNGYSDWGPVTNNTVIFNDGYIYRLYGGYSLSDNASGNNVTINHVNGIVDYISIGSGVYGGYSDMETASNNTVIFR